MCQTVFLKCRNAPKPPCCEIPNTRVSSTNELAVQYNIHSIRRRGRPQAVPTRARCEQHRSSIRTRACARKGDQVAEDFLDDTLLGGPEDTILFLRGKQLVKSTYSHRVHRILGLMCPPRNLHPMLATAHRRLTRYILRRNRVTRYRRGACGFRDCTCVLALNNPPPPLL